MTKYILHGGYTRRENELNKTFFKELLRDVPDGGNVLLVYFASETHDGAIKSFENLKQKLPEHAEGKNLNYVFATKENFLEEFDKANVVFFNGGTTNPLLETIRAFPDLRSGVGAKTVAGSSAGAYMLARYGTSHSEVHMREGIGFVPLKVICHYESPDLPPSATSVKELMEVAPDLELVRLKDCEWKVFNF